MEECLTDSQYLADSTPMKPCDSDLCKILKIYQPSIISEQPQHLQKYLESASGSTFRISLGTVGSLRQTFCPLCQFILRRMKRDDAFSKVDMERNCLVDIRPPFFLNPLFYLQDGTLRGPVSTLSERVLLLATEYNQNARLGRKIQRDTRVSKAARDWLMYCESKHTKTCPIPQRSQTTGGRPRALRVVDVVRDALLGIPWDTKYVALSYVWGDARTPKLYQADVSRLGETGSLTALRSRMPRTIQDAMIFVKELGLRYLWFDSLCLVQDDPVDLRNGIMNMDIVFEAAWVTLIAAHGSNADAGLPGVSEFPRSLNQDITYAPDLSFLRLNSLDEHLNKAVYASRGWTLQEQYLSRRTIVFVDGQAYFRCRQKLWSEDTWADSNPDLQNSVEWATNLVSLSQEEFDNGDDPEKAYTYLQDCLWRFSMRNLTFDDDAIDAMTGLLRRISIVGKTRILQGIPEARLPNFLIFMTMKARRRPSFPSWSWAGWAGMVSFEDQIGTVNITFHMVDQHGVMREIWRPKNGSDDAPHSAVRGSTLESSGSCEPWKSVPYPLLRFGASVLYLHWQCTTVFDHDFAENGAPQILLSDNESTEVGVLYHDTRNIIEVQEKSLRLVMFGKRAERNDATMATFKKSTMRHVFDGDMVWVMYIRREGHIWERRGLGMVREDYLSAGSVKTETVLLG